MLELFTKLSVPFYQKDKKQVPEIKDKVEVIEELLSELNLNTYHDELNYLMYTRGELEEILQDKFYVFITHIDLIKKFHKGFVENREPYIQKEGEIIEGALDNTITNATLIKSMLENKLKKNTIFLFTYGEESGMWGIKSFMDLVSKNVKNGTFINMDVTNEGYQYSISIEYDKPNFGCMIDLIDKYQDDHNIYYTVDRVGDDCDVVLSKGGNGLSICLPTKGLIHSWENQTTLKKINEYQSFISKLVKKPFRLKKGVDTELSFKDVFKIHKGNKEETIELLKQEEVRLEQERKERMEKWKSMKTYERPKGTYNYNTGYSLFDFTFDDDDDFEDSRWADYSMEKAGIGERHEYLTYLDVIEDLISYDETIDYNVLFLLTETLRLEPFKEHEYVPMDILLEELSIKKENMEIEVDDTVIENEMYNIGQNLIELGLIDEAQFYSYDTLFFNESINSHLNIDNLSEDFRSSLSID